MSTPVDIESAGIPAWVVEDDVELKLPQKSSPPTNNNNNRVEGDVELQTISLSPQFINNKNTSINNNDDVIIRAPTSSNGSKSDNVEIIPEYSIEDSPIALGVPVIVDREVSTGAPNMINYLNSTGTTTYNAEMASDKTWKEYFRDTFTRDGRLFIITLIILICMNIRYIWWALYPFTIFSTWIHELCHGLAGILAGGSISKLMIYKDGSGLAYTSAPSGSRWFIASAGYQGTAVMGCLGLMCRRTKRGPRTGTMIVALTMILSSCLWIRNMFGFVFILCFGLVLVAAALMLPSIYMRDAYIVLAVTCSMNAITGVQNLFGSSFTVNGSQSSSDAHTMANIVGGTYLQWATFWLVFSIVFTLIGIIFPIPGPDEVADFTWCGICQDLGCFKLCNYRGEGCAKRIFGRDVGGR